jgi:hypothetical protein
MTNPNSFVSDSEWLTSDKLYIQRARLALPILVRQAKAGTPICYNQLAQEIGMPNPRNLNYVLGAVGNALLTIAKKWGASQLPLLNCLVINQTTLLPGDGIYVFIEKQDFVKMTNTQKRVFVNKMLTEIFTFPDWDKVLIELKIEPIQTAFKNKYGPLIKPSSDNHGRGESQDHLVFKTFLSKHPEVFGLHRYNTGIIEYEFPSTDTIDILFETSSEVIGVEAKSHVSNIVDILRGLFQCIKYEALIAAEQRVNDITPNCKVFLALEGKFPDELIGIKNVLGINVIDEINVW